MSSITRELAAVLTKIRRPGDFFASGTIELLAPQLEVEGVGQIALPLLPAQAKQLVAAAEQAPFGRGEQTLVDTEVRRTWQINPDRVRIQGQGWARTLSAILTRVSDGLGVTEPVQAEFYKLLLYKRHRFLPETIAHAGWLYFRFPLSLWLIEETPIERGVVVSYETIRRWAGSSVLIMLGAFVASRHARPTFGS